MTQKINNLLTLFPLLSELMDVHVKKSQRRTLCGIFALGFASGLPFLLTLSTLSFWLAEVGVSKTTIGLFMLVGIPYSVKFLWAPAIDAFEPPLLKRWMGARRGWALLSQVGLIGSLILLSYSDPSQNIWVTALAAFLVSIFAASQDIVIDAYRIDVLQAHHMGLGAALESIGFRFGMLTSGAGALYLAYLLSWQQAYQIMAGAVFLGMLAVWLMPEHPKPFLKLVKPQKKSHQFVEPWKTVFRIDNLIWLVLFIFFFKMADTVLNAMSAPFLVDLGFSKVEFANITKVFGISLMIVGGIFGGILMQYQSIATALITCIVLQVVACLMFVIQAWVGHDTYVLAITIGVESFCSGLTSAAIIAYISTFCQAPYTATHFTVLYSLCSLCRVGISAVAGGLADYVGWSNLFILTSFTMPLAAIALMVLERQRQAAPALSKEFAQLTA